MSFQLIIKVEHRVILLIWKLPLMLSCPLHGCWLEFYQGLSGHFFGWANTDMLPRTASNIIAVMAMNLIESEILNSYGKQANLFLPEPQSDFTNGLPTGSPRFAVHSVT